MLKLYLRNCYREEDGTQGGTDDTDDVQEKPRTFTLCIVTGKQIGRAHV